MSTLIDISVIKFCVSSSSDLSAIPPFGVIFGRKGAIFLVRWVCVVRWSRLRRAFSPAGNPNFFPFEVLMSQPTFRDMVELPGPFTFKIIVNPTGIDQDGLTAALAEAAGRSLEFQSVTVRPSKNGKYQSYTVAVQIEVFEEIERIYAWFKASEHVVYAV